MKARNRLVLLVLIVLVAVGESDLTLSQTSPGFYVSAI